MLRKIITTTLMFTLVVGGYYLWLDKTRESLEISALDSIAAIEDVQSADDTSPVPEVREMTLGHEDAAVTIIEYASFTCPHCARFHETVFGKLRANYIETGKVRFIQRDVYFDRFGLWASMLARCGDGSKFFGIADMVFTTQREWTKGETNLEVVTNLKKIGRLAGMDGDQMDACLQDNAKARALIAAYQANSERDGINSTPSFLINGEKYPNMSYEDFAKVLDGLAVAQ
ncbi:MAG: DsbA family protein [Paracoccaceae bacterium]